MMNPMRKVVSGQAPESQTNIRHWRETNSKMIQRYGDSFMANLTPHQAVGWGSRESQILRFRILEAIGLLPNSTVLDIGSGLGDFFEHLRDRDYMGRYVGVDATEQMATAAKERFPDTDFLHHDVLDLSNIFKANSFDFVFASGIFAYCDFEPYEYLKSAVENMYDTAKTGVAFNCLSTRGAQPSPDECQLNPSIVLDVLQDISPWITIRHDYLPHDFTVYIYKQQNDCFD
jgi:ubiquinone/menaquinone biosynthesis C-methylase UbiE